MDELSKVADWSMAFSGMHSSLRSTKPSSELDQVRNGNIGDLVFNRFLLLYFNTPDIKENILGFSGKGLRSHLQSHLYDKIILKSCKKYTHKNNFIYNLLYPFS